MDKVIKVIKDKNLISSGDIVAVATSGGQDSMALLSFLKSKQDELGCEIIAVHVNHKIRENADRDENFVKDFCNKNKIKCYCFSVDVPKLAKQNGVSLESAGRQARYGIFDALLSKGVATKIALAHHLRDQVETILMHLFRGSGINGIKGMIVKKDENYIRPFLETSKQDIESYINLNNIPYVNDETNDQSEYRRNFLRNEILPKILEKWPNFEKNVLSFSNFAKEDDDFIQKNINLSACIFEDSVAKIPLSYFSYDNAIISRIIFYSLRKIGVFVDVESKHIDAIKQLANFGENGKRINLPMQVRVIKEYDFITLTNKKKANSYFFSTFKFGEIEVKNFGKVLVNRVKNLNINDKTSLYIDVKKLPKDAVWRFKKDGDVFTKFGGGTKKLKDFLIDKKIPNREREVIPVLASGNEVYVIAGVEISQKVKVEDDTKSIAKISVLKN